VHLARSQGSALGDLYVARRGQVGPREREGHGQQPAPGLQLEVERGHIPVQKWLEGQCRGHYQQGDEDGGVPFATAVGPHLAASFTQAFAAAAAAPVQRLQGARRGAL